ncbi:MAG: hypothetical protein PHS49_06845 [Candidatus Gracilibacteria bacterium]|nr:hypothetical protein [Candidatus Gracilibacteria bacterium]
MMYFFAILILFLIIGLFYFKYNHDKKNDLFVSNNHVYKSLLFYSFLVSYFVYAFFINTYFTNSAILFLFYSIFVIYSFLFGLRSSQKYGLFKGTLYFLIPVLLLLISFVNFTKDSGFSLIVTGFLFISFYLGIFVEGIYLLLLKNKKDVEKSFFKKLFSKNEDKLLVLEFVIPYLVGIVGIVFVLYMLKYVFDIYQLIEFNRSLILNLK